MRVASRRSRCASACSSLRMNVIGDGSHQVLSAANHSSVESKLLTPGQVADVTATVDPSSDPGTQFAVLTRSSSEQQP